MRILKTWHIHGKIDKIDPCLKRHYCYFEFCCHGNKNYCTFLEFLKHIIEKKENINLRPYLVLPMTQGNIIYLYLGVFIKN